MHLIQIESERALTLHAHRLPQHLGRDIGIAITVATDPASDAQEGSHLEAVRGGIARSELVCQSVSTAQRKAASLAEISSGVRRVRSRSARRCATSISRSMVLLRLTSVG